MVSGETIISTVASKVIELKYAKTRDEMTDFEKEEYLHQNLIGESYSFHLPPEEDPKPASLQFENLVMQRDFGNVKVTLSFDGPELQIPIRRFEEDFQFIYYELIETSSRPRIVEVLDDFPYIKETGPGDISIRYGLRNATLSRLRWSMKFMVPRIISFYYGSLHQKAQNLYEENERNYKRHEYEVPDKIKPYGMYDLSKNPEDPLSYLREPYRWAKYTKRYFEFCAGEPRSEDSDISRKASYRQMIRTIP